MADEKELRAAIGRVIDQIEEGRRDSYKVLGLCAEARALLEPGAVTDAERAAVVLYGMTWSEAYDAFLLPDGTALQPQAAVEEALSTANLMESEHQRHPLLRPSREWRPGDTALLHGEMYVIERIDGDGADRRYHLRAHSPIVMGASNAMMDKAALVSSDD